MLSHSVLASPRLPSQKKQETLSTDPPLAQTQSPHKTCIRIPASKRQFPEIVNNSRRRKKLPLKEKEKPRNPHNLKPNPQPPRTTINPTPYVTLANQSPSSRSHNGK